MIFNQPRYRYNSFLPKLFRVMAITIFPFIFVLQSEKDCPQWLKNHEEKHFNDILRFGLFRFYASYLVLYLGNRIAGMNHYAAYMAIYWEVRAREAE